MLDTLSDVMLDISSWCMLGSIDVAPPPFSASSDRTSNIQLVEGPEKASLFPKKWASRPLYVADTRPSMELSSNCSSVNLPCGTVSSMSEHEAVKRPAQSNKLYIFNFMMVFSYMMIDC